MGFDLGSMIGVWQWFSVLLSSMSNVVIKGCLDRIIKDYL